MRKRKPDDEFDPIRGFMLAAPSGDGDLGFWPLGRTAVKRLVLISLCILVVAPAEAQRDRYYHRHVSPAVERATERERPFEIVGDLFTHRSTFAPLGREPIRSIPVPANLFNVNLFKAKGYE